MLDFLDLGAHEHSKQRLDEVGFKGVAYDDEGSGCSEVDEIVEVVEIVRQINTVVL